MAVCPLVGRSPFVCAALFPLAPLISVKVSSEVGSELGSRQCRYTITVTPGTIIIGHVPHNGGESGGVLVRRDHLVGEWLVSVVQLHLTEEGVELLLQFKIVLELRFLLRSFFSVGI